MKLTKIYSEVSINETKHDAAVLFLKNEELISIMHQLDMARFNLADREICDDLYNKLNEAYRTEQSIWV